MSKKLSKDSMSNNKRHAILDDLWLQPQALEARVDMAARASDTRISIPCGSMEKTLSLPSPLIAAHMDTLGMSDPLISKLMSALAQTCGAVSLSHSYWMQLAESSRLLRNCIVPFDGMPSLEDLRTASVIELRCYERSANAAHRLDGSLIPKWPIDVPDRERFATKIQLLRQFTDHAIPVGVGLVIGDLERDIELVAKGGVDFVSLVANDENSLTLSPWVARTARQCAIQAGHSDLSIWVEADIHSGADIVKLRACGASAVLIDPLLHRYLDQWSAEMDKKSSSSFGVGIGFDMEATRTDDLTNALRDRLAGILLQLETQLEVCGCSRLGEVDHRLLRAISQDAHRLTGANFMHTPELSV